MRRKITTKKLAISNDDIFATRLVRLPYNILSSFVTEDIFANPNPIVQMATDKGLGIFAEMKFDPIISASLSTRWNSVRALDWDIIASSKDAEDMKIRDWVKDTLLNLNRDPRAENGYQTGLGAFLDAIFDGFEKGFSVIEAIWDLAEGNIKETLHHNPKGFTWIDNDQFVNYGYGSATFTGTRLIYTSGLDGRRYPAPDYKFMIFTNGGLYGNMFGESILTPCYWPWFFGFLNVLKYWVNFLDKWGQPTPIANIPLSWWQDTNLKKQILKLIANVQSEYAAMVPQTPDGKNLISLLEAQRGSTHDVYSGFMEMMNKWKVLTILGQTLTTMEAEFGTRSQSQTHQIVRHEYLGADIDKIQNFINGQFIRWIVDFKFGVNPQRKNPTFQFNMQQPKDLSKLATAFTQIVDLIDVPQQYLYELLGIPQPEKGANGEPTEPIVAKKSAAPPAPEDMTKTAVEEQQPEDLVEKAEQKGEQLAKQTSDPEDLNKLRFYPIYQQLRLEDIDQFRRMVQSEQES